MVFNKIQLKGVNLTLKTDLVLLNLRSVKGSYPCALESLSGENFPQPLPMECLQQRQPYPHCCWQKVTLRVPGTAIHSGIELGNSAAATVGVSLLHSLRQAPHMGLWVALLQVRPLPELFQGLWEGQCFRRVCQQYIFKCIIWNLIFDYFFWDKVSQYSLS